MNKNEEIKRDDQIKLLEACVKYESSGKWEGIFAYPNCGGDLVLQGLATPDKNITISGKAVLWFLHKGPDPTNSKAVETFKLKGEREND